MTAKEKIRHAISKAFEEVQRREELPFGNWESGDPFAVTTTVGDFVVTIRPHPTLCREAVRQLLEE